MIAGRYSLEREVGRGGMGAVWLGRDEVLGRPVALKRLGLLPGADEPDLERAEREARLGAGLQHQHVVAVFDLVIEDDHRWLVMEYVEGTTLAELVRSGGPLLVDTAAALMRQVADALVTAHAAGITHRDVKPSNILVTDDGVAKLSDFGIARRAGDASITQTGLLLGSPNYLAPEVASGSGGGEAADAWSFGATLFYALTGRPPYESDENVLSTLYRIVHEDPPEPDAAGWLTPLIAGTLAKDPEQRWTLGRTRDFLAGGASDAGAARVLPPAPAASAVPVPSAPAAPAAPAAEDERTSVIRTAPRSTARRMSPRLLLVGAAVVAVIAVIAVGLYAVFAGGGQERDPVAEPSSGARSTAPSGPTVAGMESFIRDYVATVSDDPGSAWKMLTPRFQTDSGGFADYRRFWESATNGRVLDISADPDTLRVSYQVHFDNHDNGPGPTVLDLVYDDGSYRIDAEHTEGFEPADED